MPASAESQTARDGARDPAVPHGDPAVRALVHDLGNALLPIVGLCDYLLAEPEVWQRPDEAARLLRQIRAAAEHTRAVLRQWKDAPPPPAAAAPLTPPAGARTAPDNATRSA